MNEDKTRVEHIIDHGHHIQMMLQDITEEQFYNSSSLVDAVSFNYAILGEAASRISKELRDNYPDIPWRAIIAMRNFLIHEYVKIKPRYLWETAQNDLEPFIQKMEEILKLL